MVESRESWKLYGENTPLFFITFYLLPEVQRSLPLGMLHTRDSVVNENHRYFLMDSCQHLKIIFILAILSAPSVHNVQLFAGWRKG